MRCLRCQGMMVRERVVTQEGGLSMARCVICGDVIDSVVLRNRFLPSPPMLARGGRHYGLGVAQ